MSVHSITMHVGLDSLNLRDSDGTDAEHAAMLEHLADWYQSELERLYPGTRIDVDTTRGANYTSIEADTDTDEQACTEEIEQVYVRWQSSPGYDTAGQPTR